MTGSRPRDGEPTLAPAAPPPSQPAADRSTPAPTPSPTGRTRRQSVIVLAVAGLGLVVILAAATLLGLATSPRASDSPAGAGRIAVIAADGSLRTVDGAGGAERRYPITSGAGPDRFPAWSPDGASLATVGLDATGGGLFVLDDRASGASPERLPAAIYRSEAQLPFYLYWSPDGRQLSFLTSEPDGIALRSAPADGSSEGGIVRRGEPLYWDWTGPERVLVHVGGDGPAAYIGELRLDGTEERRTAGLVGPFQAPAVSADGRRRAYVVADEQGHPVIVVEDGRDGSLRRLAVGGTTAVAWAPGSDGRLAYIAPPSETAVPIGPLDVLAPGTTEPRRLLDADVLAFFWSPDSRHIAAIGLPGERRDVAARLSPMGQALSAAPAALPGGRGLAARLSLPPDPPSLLAASGVTLRFVIVDSESGAIELDQPVEITETFAGVFLPYFDQYARSHRIWSPASDALVLPLVGPDRRAHITVVPVDGSQPAIIADGEMAFWGP